MHQLSNLAQSQVPVYQVSDSGALNPSPPEPEPWSSSPQPTIVYQLPHFHLHSVQRGDISLQLQFASLGAKRGVESFLPDPNILSANL